MTVNRGKIENSVKNRDRFNFLHSSLLSLSLFISLVFEFSVYIEFLYLDDHFFFFLFIFREEKNWNNRESKLRSVL